MAVYVNTSALVRFQGLTSGGAASLTVTNNVKSVTFNTDTEIVDLTGMGYSSRVNASGLKVWSAELELFNDMADNNLDEALGSNVGTTCYFKICPGVGGTPTTSSATNPTYWGLALIESYTPMQDKVGDGATCKVVLKAAGDLTRATSLAWDVTVP